MSKRIVTALTTVLLMTGCVKEISSDERLERETKRSEFSAESAGDLLKLKCDDITSALSKARDDTQPEERRLSTYTELFDKVKERNTRFEESLSRNPDLAYQEGSAEVIAARDGCIQAAADVRLDFEGLVREIINLPVVDEYRDNKPVKAARINFDVLRDSIEKLGLDDKDALFTRLANAEKTVEVKEPSRRKK